MKLVDIGSRPALQLLTTPVTSRKHHVLHGRRMEERAFAEGRGPDPRTNDNVGDVTSGPVRQQDPLQ